MIIIGICGQSGAGKSTLAEILSEMGMGENLEVDQVGHALLDRADIKERLVTRFGPQILDNNGVIVRKNLAQAAFETDESVAKLNKIMHPAMREIVKKDIERHREAGKEYLIINAALLFSMELDQLCHQIIYVQALPELRLSRLVNIRNWSEKSARERLFAQDELPEKSGIIVVENNESPHDLEMVADTVAEDIRRMFNGKTEPETN